MKVDTSRLLQQQAQALQDLPLSSERAGELAPVVESFVGAVADNAALLPFDVDATAFYTALHAFKDDWSPS
jgi:hypothetical protein